MSSSRTHLSRPMTSSSSFAAFAIISGCRRSSDIAHSIVVAEVSVPPTIRSWVNPFISLAPSLTSRLGSSSSSSNTSSVSLGTQFSPSAFLLALCSTNACSKSRSKFLAKVFILFS
uniref:Uncharacterized protein n=1 Tax=Opuntia streptacantha TaxID=393608 RepID=A0A7C9DXB2_OPUST